MRFERKIKYLDYLENGERVRGGGFLKLETGAENFKMELTVKGVRGEKESVRDVILCGNGREAILGKIQLMEGQGEFRYTCRLDSEMGDAEIGDTGITYEKLAGIRIPLGEGREAACIWEAEKRSTEREEKPSAKQAERQRPSGRSLGKPSAKHGKSVEPSEEQSGKYQQSMEPSEEQSGKYQQSVEPSDEQSGKHQQSVKPSEEQSGKHQQSVEPPAKQSGKHQQSVKPLAKQPEKQKQRDEPLADQAEGTVALSAGRRSDEISETALLKENKWLQLCAIYPHINPFQDQREYLSIGPEDFVLLSEDSYKAAGNSFMLHGYYNYRHLILAREERRGEIVYYVGVPGNYYDREKQVAVMFGFESFECAQEPAQSSDFGYYMMRVQL